MKCKTIIKLIGFDFDEDESQKYYYDYVIGYFSSYEKAEEVMKQDVDVNHTLYQTEEIPLDFEYDENIGDIIRDYTTYRQYRFLDNKMILFHETKYDFKGYTEEMVYPYKVGNIIEYFGNDEKIYVGIIDSLPPVYGKYQSLDNTDDSYLIYDLGEGDTHDHIMTKNIIGLAKLDWETRKKYKDKLQERQEFYGAKN